MFSQFRTPNGDMIFIDKNAGKEYIMQKIFFRKAVAAVLTTCLFVAASMPLRATGEQVAGTGFADVTKLYWAAKSIEFAAQHGIVNGYKNPNGSFNFKPKQNVTCEDFPYSTKNKVYLAGWFT